MEKESTNTSEALGRAPGRMDFLGGVADYSGGHVLEIPLRKMTTVRVRSTHGNDWVFTAEGREAGVVNSAPWRSLLREGFSVENAGKLLRAMKVPAWSLYPFGCLLVWAADTGWAPPNGLSFSVSSEVPVAMGVSSSAALEIATLRALRQLSGIDRSDLQLAHLGQAAENRIVGAPCGLMDQLASSCGAPGQFLPICCQPDLLGEPVPLPKDLALAGWASGVAHSVGGSPYGMARAASFMGKKILETVLGETLDYTGKMPWPDLAAQVADLPQSLSGKTFLRQWGEVEDPLTEIDPARHYPVQASTRFPMEESQRVQSAVHLWRELDAGKGDRLAQLLALGRLLHESHRAYSDMGLGCPETDKMVSALAAEGAEKGFYGSRISGGGAGGTVVILVERKALPRLETICDQWKGPASGKNSLVFV
ncbi:MAG: hypothetical protein JJT75_10575 [Opitutales bacterium]|nr:hypothetical protein [Opitutales bacterium]MCH8541043.1 hypothetical protein [Opitutales bacterium]